MNGWRNRDSQNNYHSKMSRIIFTFIVLEILMISASFGQIADERGYIVSIGDSVPKFGLEFTDGTQTTMNDLRGNVVMLQFTASWCSVCRKEMPHIEKEIWRVYKNLGLVVIGIDRDEPVKTVRQFAKETQISYPLGLDPDADIFGLFSHKESGVTRNVIINPEGKIVFLTRLFDPEEFEKMIQVIHSELEKLVNQEQNHLEQEKLSLESQLTELDKSIQKKGNNKELQNTIQELKNNILEKVLRVKIEEEKLHLRKEKLREIKSS